MAPARQSRQNHDDMPAGHAQSFQAELFDEVREVEPIVCTGCGMELKSPLTKLDELACIAKSNIADAMRPSDAFRLLVQSVQSELLYFVVRRCVPMPEAEDVVQSVVISVGRGLRNYNHIVPIIGWFYARATYRVTDFHRRRRRRPTFLSLESGRNEHHERKYELAIADDKKLSPLSWAIMNEEISWLRASIGTLENEVRIVVLMRSEGYTFEEIATCLDCAPSTAHTRYERGLAALKTLADQREQGPRS